MPESHRQRLEKLDPYQINVRFSPRVKGALADLDAAVRSSKHFDGDSYAILHDWAYGKAPTIREVIVSLPLIAEDMFEHLKVTGDKRAEDAWRELCNQLLEKGFTLTQRERQR